MARIKPFAALRPRADVAARVSAPPYDVVTADEAARLAGGNPLSFLHVSRAEIDLPAGVDAYAPAVYARARETFHRLRAEGVLRQDEQPCFYLYRLVMGAHSQVGLVATVSCEDYLQQAIRKHELTRPDKETDRARHIAALDAQTGPAFLVYPALAEVDKLVARWTQSPPQVDFTAEDGVRHSTWTIAEAVDIRFLENAFASIPRLYIADGHHRSAAAVRVFRERDGAGHSAWFLAVLFPHTQVRILPYNRLVKDLNGLTREAFLARLSSVGSLDPVSARPVVPDAPGTVGIYLAGRWFKLRFAPQLAVAPTPAERLDVALLQRHVLDAILGIRDPRTSHRLEFVGGIRGLAALERPVDAGQHACAFALSPTRIEDLLAVADAGGVMPPKSTWFEPKLRDGLFSHLI